MLWLLALACMGTHKQEPQDSAPVLPPKVECAPTDNPLRIRCNITLDVPRAVQLDFGAPGLPTRSFHSEAPAQEHRIVAWGLRPDTTYTWQLNRHSGEVSTGSVPDPLASADVQVSGELWDADAVLLPLPCGEGNYFVMYDGQGELIWYQRLDESDASAGYTWDPSGPSVLASTGNQLIEVDVYGRTLLHLYAGRELLGSPHHDVGRWQGYTYALTLFQREDGVHVDRVEVLDGREPIAQFAYDDLYELDPEGATGAWTHANAINLSAEGQIVLSALSFDHVLALDGDPASPTFLEAQWSAAPDTVLDPDPTFVPEDDMIPWDRQHATARYGDELWLFDNRGDPAASRGLRMAMDEAAGELQLLDAWSMGQVCPAHGGAFPLDGGGLITCGSFGDIWAFRHGETEPSWRLNAWCGLDVETVRLTKGTPVWLP